MIPHDPTWRANILAILDSGVSQQRIANDLGVTKNVIAGIWARSGRGVNRMPFAKTTMADRLDALHVNLDAVLAVTRGVGRLPPEPRKH